MLDIQRFPDGHLEIRIPCAEAQFLMALPSKLHQVLTQPDTGDKIIRQLFPEPYDDPEQNKEYRKYTFDEIRNRKMLGVHAFAKTLRNWTRQNDMVLISVSKDEFSLWLGFVNDMRLVLGTELEITDAHWNESLDPGDPRFLDKVILHYLSWLEERLIAADGFTGLKLSEEDIQNRDFPGSNHDLA